MKKVSNGFKEALKDVKQISTKIINISNGEQTEVNDDNIYPSSYINKGGLLKSVMREIDVELSNNLEIGSIITFQEGVLVDDNYEYVNFGNYIIVTKEKNEDTNTYTYKAYDKMIRTQVDYVPLDDSLFPITFKNYLKKQCERLNISYEDNNFANQDRVLVSDPFPPNNGYKYRDVFDDIAEACGGTIIINNNDNLQVKYPTETNETLDEYVLNNNNVKFGEIYGEINSVVLSRSGDSDKIYRLDDKSVEKNGLQEITINDNLFLNGNDRAEWLDEILAKVKGIKYTKTNFTSKGILYLDMLDYYTAKVGDNSYKCLLLNDEIKIDQGITEDIYSDEASKNSTDYSKSDKEDIKGLNQTTLIVDKKAQEIQSSIQKSIDDIQINLSQVINTVNDINAIFSVTGGNNLIKNSQFLFADNNGTWIISETGNNSYNNLGASYDSGLLGKTISTAKIQLRNIKVKTTDTNIINLNPNSSYTLSYKYSQDDMTETTITLVGVNTGQEVLNVTYSNIASFRSENFKFIAKEQNYILTIKTTTTTADITKGYFYLYDLMLNAGEKLNWQVASGETYSTNTRLSRNGIAIYSTGSGVMTSLTAGAANIRKAKSVEDYSGEVITDFNENGVDTKRLKANEVQVGNYIMLYNNNHYYEYME